MSIYGELFARIYDPVLARGERAGMRALRAELLAQARGDVLEIGAGTGLNMPHYPASVSTLTLTDPESPMVDRLQKAVADHPLRPRVIEVPAEKLPFDDDSFDTVVSALVLCTVVDVGSTLGEVRRVLRPGGALLLVEHVRGDAGLSRWQDRLHGPWKAVGYGCNCNRNTVAALDGAGFTTTELRPGHWKGMPAIVAPLIVGAAAPIR
jgi:ubiquinone/menaquinone biosynthesis C-methylase UbiE